MENNVLTFALNFKNSGSIGLIETTEPIKFDGSSFTVSKEKLRHGRDVRFANKEVSLFFHKGEYDMTENPLQLPDGSVIYQLTQGFEWLLDTYQNWGFEAKVEQVLQLNGSDFTTGELIIINTDLATFFECKVRENTAIAEIKRHSDTTIDIFSSQDINGNHITPVSTVNMFMEALPVDQSASWKDTGDNALGFAIVTGNESEQNTIRAGANNINVPVTYGIEDSLSYISPVYNLVLGDGAYIPDDGINYTYLDAKEELTNVTISITELDATASCNVTDTIWAEVAAATGRVRFLVIVAADIDAPRLIEVLYEKNFSYSGFTGLGEEAETLPTELTLEIPLILRGERVYIYMESIASATFTGGTGSATFRVFSLMNGGKISITGTSTAIGSVMPVVRQGDLLKQIAKGINGMELYAPDFEPDGAFYNQMVCTGNLMRGILDKPFPVEFKDAYADLIEYNSDYQITPDEIFIGRYPKFYANKDLGGFLSVPQKPFESSQNDDYALKGFNLEWERFEQGDDQKDTNQSVHTQTKWLTPNQNCENVMTVKIGGARDPKLFEKLRKLSIATGSATTSLSDDDKRMVIDAIELAPGTRNTFSGYFLMRIEDGKLQILNSSGDEQGTFSWDRLGFNVGAAVTINSGENMGAYLVDDLQPSVITLLGTPDFEGKAIITFEYPLQNVQYKNRSDEGFTSVEGVDNPGKFSNLRFTPKRILLDYFGETLATACKYYPNGLFKNTYFKNGGNLTTNYLGQGELTEKDPIDIADLPEPILSTEVIKVSFVCTFDQAKDYFTAMQTINDDDSIGGFIRVLDPRGRIVKGYGRENSYVWADGVMTVELEIKNESSYLAIDTLTSNVITIAETGYDLETLASQWFDINGDYLTVYDANNIPITNPTKYDRVKVNGVVSESAEALALALNDL